MDDDPAVRKLLATIVGLHGHEVVASAGSGISGLALIQELKPDLAILDNTMPGQLCGLDVLAAIRGDETIAAIPVILHTSDTGGVQDEAEFLGAVFLAKPSTPLDVLSALRAAVPDEGSVEVPSDAPETSGT